jgi:hypothetical protein
MVLGVHILSVSAGNVCNCMSGNCCNCISDDSSEEQPVQAPPYRVGKTCIGGPPPGGLWACEDPSIEFPTVECLLADYKLCGVINAHNVPSIFYSFGVTLKTINGYLAQSGQEGNLYSDLLDTAYWDRVMQRRSDTFQAGTLDRRFVLIARSSEAYALACEGDVYVYVGQRRNPTSDTDLGAFQLPWDPKAPNPAEPEDENIWRTFELPTLQRNKAVTRIISVDVSNNFKHDVDWENGQSPPGLDNVLLPASTASTMNLPPVPAGLKRFKRDNSTEADMPIVCPVPLGSLSTTTPASKSSSHASTATSPASKSPSHTSTATSPASKSPSHASTTTSPTSKSPSHAPTTTPPPAQTGKATANILVGSSAVTVGTLTGTALYTSVSSALEKLCPTVTQTKSLTSCVATSVAIPKIQYIKDGSLFSDGELNVQVQVGNYNSTALRNAMIKSTAVVAEKASNKKTSCSSLQYTVSELEKRDDLEFLPPSRIHNRRNLTYYERDHIEPEQQSTTLCTTTSFSRVQYFGQYWREANTPNPEAELDVTWEFQVAPGLDFVCDFIEDLEVALDVVAPEFAIAELEVQPAMIAGCQKDN